MNGAARPALRSPATSGLAIRSASASRAFACSAPLSEPNNWLPPTDRVNGGFMTTRSNSGGPARLTVGDTLRQVQPQDGWCLRRELPAFHTPTTPVSPVDLPNLRRSSDTAVTH